MKTYSKRVAFVISSQHLIPHGGIGQFCKGFCEMANDLGWIVDIIMDKEPNKGPFKEYLDSVSGKFVYPQNPLSNKNHTQTFAFSDSYSLERMVNFRDSMMIALQSNVYDLIVVNTPEAIVPLYGLDIQEFIPLVFYTHNENMVFKDTNGFKGVFNGTFDEFFGRVIASEGIVIGTQSQRNVEELSVAHKPSVHLPMPMPERGLLEPYNGETEGVLFIGRWEERKNPKEFLRVIEETRLPARVMTNENGAKNFEKELKRIGVPYDIRVQIIGQEKVDFIKSSRVFYMPSKSESYGFAFFESHGHVPSVVLEDYSWHSNFDQNRFSVVSKNDASSKILNLYNDRPSTDLSYVKKLHDDTMQPWKAFVDEFKPKTSTSDAASVNKEDDIFVDVFIKSLGRFASIEDVKSILANRHKFKIKYTKDGSWMSKSGNDPAEDSIDVWGFE